MLTELEALIILTSIPHLGSIRIRTLIHHYGTAVKTLEADPSEINKFPDFGNKVAPEWGRWRQNHQWQKNIDLAEKHLTEIVPYTSPLYPKRLLEIPDFPVILYIKGRLRAADQRCLAVIGTRQASIYGNEMADKISYDLARSGFTVVSGLARGIDTAAHQGALRGGRTIAVIGSGLLDIYPRENLRLADEICEKGVLISEFPMETPPDRQNFPQRNRIVSGMTLGTLLIEAPVKSGAMITVDRAGTYKRKLFALPGRVDSETFGGNHQIIKRGLAKLIENAQDISDSFDDLFSYENQQMRESKPSGVSLEPEEREFLRLLPNQELTIDEMMQLTKQPIMRINVLIMSLVLKKAMKEFPGRIYKKVS